MTATMLPPEIFLLIHDELGETQDRLRALRVCKHWNNLLFAKAYSSIKLSNPEILLTLAEALQKSPRLQPLIHELRIPTCSGYSLGSRGYYNHDLFHEFLKSFTDKRKELTSWEKRLDHRDIYSWLAVVLISLPKLQHLDILWGGFRDYAKSTLWAVSTIAKKSPSAQIPLQHLRRLTARIQDDGIEFSIRQFTPFLHLPAMQALHLSGMVDGDAKDAKKHTFGISYRRPLRKSPVFEIVLRGSSILSDLPAPIAVRRFGEHESLGPLEQYQPDEKFIVLWVDEGSVAAGAGHFVPMLPDAGMSQLIEGEKTPWEKFPLRFV